MRALFFSLLCLLPACHTNLAVIVPNEGFEVEREHKRLTLRSLRSTVERGQGEPVDSGQLAFSLGADVAQEDRAWIRFPLSFAVENASPQAWIIRREDFALKNVTPGTRWKDVIVVPIHPQGTRADDILLRVAGETSAILTIRFEIYAGEGIKPQELLKTDYLLSGAVRVEAVGELQPLLERHLAIGTWYQGWQALRAVGAATLLFFLIGLA